MEIAKNTVVTLNYTVKDPDGNIIDDGHHPWCICMAVTTASSR
jgi:FKBP-type peptidyl-prolyl cis-trans isomerase 2